MKRKFNCDRCENGQIREYGHVDNGVCWKCNGTGKLKYNPQVRGFGGNDTEEQERAFIEWEQQLIEQTERDAFLAVNGFFDDESENYYHG